MSNDKLKNNSMETWEIVKQIGENTDIKNYLHQYNDAKKEFQEANNSFLSSGLKTIDKERESLIKEWRAKSNIYLYHKYFGKVHVMVSTTNRLKYHKITPNSKKVSRYHYNSSYLFTDEEMTKNVPWGLASIEHFYYDPILTAKKKEKSNILDKIIEKISDTIKNIAENRESFYLFENGHSAILIYREHSITEEGIRIQFSSPKSEFRTRRYWNLNF